MKNISAPFIEKTMIISALFAITLGIIGAQWDSWSHVKQGHVLLATPHLVVIFGLGLFVLASVLSFCLMRKIGKNLPAGKKRSLVFAIGGVLIPPALMLDEAWHAFFGLDQTTWSPPHALLFMGIACILLGLGFYCASPNKLRDSIWPSKCDVLPMLFFGTVLLLGIMSLGDFDHPQTAWIAGTRPGAIYPITVTGMNVLVFLMITLALRRVWASTIVAIFAWSFHAATAFLIATVGGFWHTALPFPIVVPALIIDMWLLFLLQNPRLKISPHRLFCGALIATILSYWSVVAWALFYTKLPQQIPNHLNSIIISGALFVILMSIGITFIAGFTAKYFLKTSA